MAGYPRFAMGRESRFFAVESCGFTKKNGDTEDGTHEVFPHGGSGQEGCGSIRVSQVQRSIPAGVHVPLAAHIRFMPGLSGLPTIVSHRQRGFRTKPFKKFY